MDEQSTTLLAEAITSSWRPERDPYATQLLLASGLPLSVQPGTFQVLDHGTEWTAVVRREATTSVTVYGPTAGLVGVVQGGAL